MARFLIGEAERPGPRLTLPGARQEIPGRLGTVRELVPRALAALRARGAIDIAGRIVTLRDAGGLARNRRGGRGLTGRPRSFRLPGAGARA